jgi:hypothetical protein
VQVCAKHAGKSAANIRMNIVGNVLKFVNNVLKNAEKCRHDSLNNCVRITALILSGSGSPKEDKKLHRDMMSKCATQLKFNRFCLAHNQNSHSFFIPNFFILASKVVAFLADISNDLIFLGITIILLPGTYLTTHKKYN